MQRQPGARGWRLTLVLLFAWPALAALVSGPRPGVQPAQATAVQPPDTIFGLTLTGLLVRFSSDAPGTFNLSVPISGLEAGAYLAAIDFRPQTRELFGLSVNNISSTIATGRLYIINPVNGVATPVGATAFYSSFAASAAFGIDFNPVFDRIRVVNTARTNLRVNPNSGTLAGHDLDLTYGTPISPTVAAVAYDRNVTGGTLTTLYGINFQTDHLVMIGGINGVPSANGGLVTNVGPLGVITTNTLIGLDIAKNGKAYAALKVGSQYGLYTVNLSTGAVTLVGAILNGSTAIVDITVMPPFNLYLPLTRK